MGDVIVKSWMIHMNFLKDNKAIRNCIEILTCKQPNSEPIMIAVAYWGKRVEYLISDNRYYKIVCNLSDGGTNPDVISDLMKKENVEIRKLERLHSKVFITEKSAIVGSSNFSQNGLGLDSCIGTIEAAIETSETLEIMNWFDQIWGRSSKITDKDINKARSMFSVCDEKVFENVKPKPEEPINENELFDGEPIKRNKTRMASSRIVNHYCKNESIDISNRTARRVTAHAANLVWVAAGNSVETAISDKSIFKTMDDVFSRMTSKGIKTQDKVLSLLATLKEEKGFSYEIRYWAEQAYIYLERKLLMDK
ncbi:hypothetical protein D5R81_02895 [Parashewanella spongiae]|uniref:PLD phosphodiesterase domain-containing protein n=1 Tax=Parashewanella spongiae TaxID=342950 RepID=A0A3A6TS81_9GAMM|nr:phospholipase D family protein [Parashewanella spongiae]MCL1077378.1 phospholipase D family protein [Parashewanella spongiae]RJY18996.1 hypothetical protein D5R81_02895 [Parashewanella spongiae]